jgi:hypothetical protein
MDPTLHGTRGCRRLVAEACHSDEPDHLGRAGATRWWRPAFTQTIQQTCVSRTPATVSSTTTAAPCSQGQPAAAHRPPKARQLPAGVPATGERPGHQTGLSSSRGVRLFPRRLAARVVVRGAYPLRRCPITSLSSSKTTQRTSALPQSSGMQGVPPASLGRRSAIACGPSECCIGSRLAGQAASKGADRARPR